MKVLVISHNPFSKSSNNGKTLESIFSQFPENSIIQIYFHESENPDLDFHAKYFRITDKEIIKRMGFIGPKPGRLINQIDQGNISQNNLSKKEKYRSLMLSVRDLIWKFTFKKLDLAYQWLDQEKPDVVFYVGGDSIFSHNIAVKVSKKLNIPLAVYFTDDYILNPQTDNIIDKVRNSLLRKIFKKTVSHAKLCFAIGDSMKKEYTKFFHRNFETIMNCIDVIPKQDFHLKKNDITISYFGGLHLNRDLMILRLGKILSDISEEKNCHINLNIYSGQKPSVEVLYLFKNNNITYCGFVKPENIAQKMKESDFLLHVENDSDYFKSITQLSVSTKIPEYLISSIPIIAFGPPDVASFELLNDNKIGSVISSKLEDYEIKKQFVELISDEELLQKRVSKAYNYAVNNFNKEKNSSKLYHNLKNLVHENSK